MFSPPESGGMTHLLDKNTPGVQSGAKKKSCTISSVKKKLYDRNHDFNRVHNVSCMQNLGGGGEGVIKVHYGLGENSELFIVVEAQPRPQ